MQIKPLQHHLERFIYFYAVVGSIVMALIIWSWRQPFSSDGIVYLYAAQVYQQHGLHAAMRFYSWPFLSVLIASISSLTHLSLLHAAYLFNWICDTITLLAAIALASAFGFSRRQQLLLLLLLLIFPWFNHFRSHILRGHGYYAASLVGMLLLIYHAKRPRLVLAIGFSLLALIATLFRIEGVFILLLAPLALLFGSEYEFGRRCWAVISCYVLPAVVLGLIVGMALLHHGSWTLSHVAQVKSDIILPMHRPLQAFLTARDKIAQYALPFHALSDSNWILTAGLIALLLRQVIMTLGGVYLLLALYTFWQYPWLPQRQARRVVWAYLIITLLAGVAFLIHDLFLADRYIALFVLIVVLLLPHGLERLYERVRCYGKGCRRAVLGVVLLLLLFNLIASVWYFGSSKAYVVEAGNWVRDYLPGNAKIYIADSQLAYYSGQEATGIALRQHPISLNIKQLSVNWGVYDYIAVKFSRKKEKMEKAWIERFGQPVKTFGHPDDGIVVIFAQHSNHSMENSNK